MTACITILLTFPILLCLDGPSDNLPNSVRRIPKIGVVVPDDQRAEMRSELAKLESLIAELDSSSDEKRIDAELIDDITIFHRAVDGVLSYQEFFRDSEIKDGFELIAQGKDRASQLLEGAAPWTNDTGLVVRGYKSKIDHSVQPYGLVIPENYVKQNGKKFRLDVWLHGRGETLSEVNFLTQRLNDKGIFFQDDTIVLHPYARYSNAMKFAGEVDVLEAIESVKKRYRIDESRISIRGFSMGGAGCWQLAVHYPDLWFAANPVPVFADSAVSHVVSKEKLDPTWYEEKLWQLYDCTGYAANLKHLPVIAYSGENDIQKQAADMMEAAFEKRAMKLNHIIGAGMGHKYDPESIAIVSDWLNKTADAVKPVDPSDNMQLETYTLKYNRNHHLRIDGLQEHWKRSRLIFTGGKSVDTWNVTQFSIRNPAPHKTAVDGNNDIELVVDGQTINCPLAEMRDQWLTFHRQGDTWKFGPLTKSDGHTLRKIHNLQGPIDDALMDSFIFVRPTGTAWNEKAAAWSAAELLRATNQWRRQFRGNARIKKDTEITAEDIATSNLILWGDPGSNLLYGKIAEKLPITWSEKEISVGDKSYDAANHALIAIYPNPLNPQRYVVLNSSFTFREFAYLNNARQVPKLPDWAIINLDTRPDSLWPGRVIDANFFDEEWKLK